MRLHPAWGFVLLFLAMLVFGSLAGAAEPAIAAPAGYERQKIEGFTVLVNKAVLARGNDRFGRRPLDVLEKELNDLKRILVPRIVAVLQEVPIWAEWDESDKVSPGAVARYYGGSAEGFAKIGGDPRKANCVEVLTLRRLGEIRHPGTALQQIIILHEMAHVVHHRLLGWGNPELEAVFQQAVDRRLYDEVNDRFGRRGKAYARTNDAEYFAEISCAFLDSCNYYPFNQEQLRSHDPTGYKLVERVWTQPERFTVIARKPQPSQPAGVAAASEAPATAPTRVRTDIYAERDALLLLDKLKVQLVEGRTEQARQGLADLVRTFPRTDAADEARRLLKDAK
jgi:hypothetical protein